MTPAARRWILTIGGLATAATVALGWFVLHPNEQPSANTDVSQRPATAEEVADQFIAAFAAGDAQSAGALTDDAASATQLLTAFRQDLAPTSASANRTAQVGPDGATPFEVSWVFGAGRSWSYASTMPMKKTGEEWRVHWTPALVHPKLTAGNRIVQRDREGQPAVLDRTGTPLLIWQSGKAIAADPTIAPLLTPSMARTAATQGGSAGDWHIALVDGAGTVLERLTEAQGTQGKPLTTTLSIATQRAAQAAVDRLPQGAMLVAIQPSTGDLLAVAQNSAAGADPVALSGLYPPGSTFKIATTTAVLETGLATGDTVLPCPGETRIGSRTISNDNNFAAGDVPLHTAFAKSCNTTLATLAAGLPPDGLSGAASQLGLNADFDIPGLTTEVGKIEPAASETQRVEDSIGQGVVQASPLGIALMSATVASGKAVTPTLWRELPTSVSAGYEAPPRAILDQLRRMMREVVTGGTATALGGQGPVAGKTGTAQFADGSHAHGWFTGYRNDLAFAVLVLSGESSAPAVSSAKAFLAAAS